MWYNGIGDAPHNHEKVGRSAKKYVNGMASVNGIEERMGGIKTRLFGTWRQAAKHLRRYIDEFSFHLNEGNCAKTTIKRLEAIHYKIHR